MITQPKPSGTAGTGQNFAGSHCDVLVTDQLLQFWIGDQLVEAVTRTDPRPIRKKRAAGTSPRR